MHRVIAAAALRSAVEDASEQALEEEAELDTNRQQRPSGSRNPSATQQLLFRELQDHALQFLALGQLLQQWLSLSLSRCARTDSAPFVAAADDSLQPDASAQHASESCIEDKKVKPFVGGSCGVFHPNYPLKIAWDLFLSILIVYSVSIIPLRLGFAIEELSDYEEGASRRDYTRRQPLHRKHFSCG